MKKCPACHSTYTDKTLIYCLQDGVPLEDATPEPPEAETVMRPRVPEQVHVPVDAANDDGSAVDGGSRAITGDDSSGTRTFVTILTTVLIMLLLFAVLAVSGYLYLNRGVRTGQTATNSNANQIASSPSPANVAGTPLVQKTPAPSITPETPNPTPSGTPDQAELERRVSERVNEWAGLARSRNLNSYMALYGDRIDYYNKRGATKAFVRTDKLKAFTKYEKLEIELGDLSISQLKDGLVSAEFDKAFSFTAPNEAVSGKVRSRLVFRDTGGELKIVSERDTKVYYVNK